MRKVFRRRRPSLTFGPCITSLIHSSPASRKANRRRSAGVGLAGVFVEQALAREQPVHGRGGKGVVDAALAGGADEGFDRERGVLGLERDEQLGDLGGRRRGRPRSARDFGYSASNPPLRYRLSQSRMVSTATRVRRVPGMM